MSLVALSLLVTVCVLLAALAAALGYELCRFGVAWWKGKETWF